MTNKTLLERLMDRLQEASTSTVHDAELTNRWKEFTNDFKAPSVSGTTLSKLPPLAPKFPDKSNRAITNEGIVKAVFASLLNLRAIVPMFATPSMTESIMPASTETADIQTATPNYIWRTAKPSAAAVVPDNTVTYGAYTFLLEANQATGSNTPPATVSNTPPAPVPTATNKKVLLQAPGKYHGLYIDMQSKEIYTNFVRGLLVAPTMPLSYSQIIQSGKFNAAPGNAAMSVRRMLEYASRISQSVLDNTMQRVFEDLPDLDPGVVQLIKTTPAVRSVLLDCTTIGVLDAMNVNQESGVRPWAGADALRSTLYDGTRQPLFPNDPALPHTPAFDVWRDRVLDNVTSMPPLSDARPNLGIDIQKALRISKSTDMAKVYASGNTLVHQILGGINHNISSIIGESLTQGIIDNMGDGWDGDIRSEADKQASPAKVSKLDAIKSLKVSPSDPDMRKCGFIIAYFTTQPGYAINLQYAPYFFPGDARNSSPGYKAARHKSSVTPGISLGAAKHITALSQNSKQRVGDLSPVTADEFIAMASSMDPGNAASSFRGSKEGNLYTKMVETFYTDGKFTVDPSDPNAVLLVTLPELLTQEVVQHIKIPVLGRPAQYTYGTAKKLVSDYCANGCVGEPTGAPQQSISTLANMLIEGRIQSAKATTDDMESGTSSILADIVGLRNMVMDCLLSGLWTTDKISGAKAQFDTRPASAKKVMGSPTDAPIRMHSTYALFNAFSWPTDRGNTTMGNAHQGILDPDILSINLDALKYQLLNVERLTAANNPEAFYTV